MSSTANSIAPRSIPRRIAFCIAETQVIALRPFLVSGIIGHSVLRHRADNGGFVRDLCRGDRSRITSFK
ncbi:hypothetical protein KIP88_45110 [Bradyrhizobium sp. SRL28]|uniref:hypothetical protein n=1 Tax=Bradyrhizobium sp. SRL28 TaxID=2836178 RepID=UPI001BDF7023|nr:hypothetical protein [Bradyrhizobium sp. SRL28]MBT1517475.1 hypothetical protein [Bradyrhizobium sp. SRL28]